MYILSGPRVANLVNPVQCPPPSHLPPHPRGCVSQCFPAPNSTLFRHALRGTYTKKNPPQIGGAKSRLEKSGKSLISISYVHHLVQFLSLIRSIISQVLYIESSVSQKFSLLPTVFGLVWFQQVGLYILPLCSVYGSTAHL
jgi:hypothetical protein